MTSIITPESAPSAGRQQRLAQAQERAGTAQLLIGLRGLLGRRRPHPGEIVELLVAANHHRGEADGPDITPCERVVLDRCPAQAEIIHGTRRMRRRAWWRDWHAARLSAAQLRGQQFSSRSVCTPGGGLLSADELATEIAVLDGGIRADSDAGACEHDRVPWGLRLIPWFIATFDFMLLLYFMAVVFNVAPGQELSIQGLAALLFALLGGAVALGWLTLLGDRLRSLRERSGEIGWSRSGWTTRAMLAVGLAVIAAVGLLMFIRVQHEVNDAFFSGASPGAFDVPLLPSSTTVGDTTSASARPVAAVFAMLSVAGNLAIIAVHALDGSTRQRRLTRLCRLAYRRYRSLERWERRIERRRRRLDRHQLRSQRAIAVTLANAQNHLRDAAAGLNAGRAASRRPALPTPRVGPDLVDLSALDVMTAETRDD